MRTGKRRNAHKITFASPEGKILQETQAHMEKYSSSRLLSNGICIHKIYGVCGRLLNEYEAMLI
jgi:hypothetical protein